VKPRKNRILERVRNSLPIEVDSEIMSGVPVFDGTRVPVATFFDYLMKGASLDEFLECFPTVTPEAALQVLEHSKRDGTI
jgi:uncharacterized protein (DUF433 family)